MADTNWIKLNRKIWENFIWSFEKPQYALAWIDMLLMANYMDKQILFNGKVETIQRGSFVSSMLKLAMRWNMNRKTVKSFLDMLQDNGMITYSTTKRRTTVFISNYLTYQGFAGFEITDDGQPTGQLDGQLTGQPTGQLDGHNIRRLKNIKESEESKEVYITGSDEPEPAPKDKKIKKHKYGEYKNVLISDEELEKLKAEYPDWEDRIERLSSYMASSGKRYKSHYATIRNWARKDEEKNGKAANDSWSAQRIGNHV